MNPELKKFTEEELLEELVRRKNRRGDQRAKAANRWCDDCENFIFWEKACDPPDDYNPCSRGHEMKFCTPDSPNDDYGFYRIVCSDRVARKGS